MFFERTFSGMLRFWLVVSGIPKSDVSEHEPSGSLLD
jgi:hypothetical protein